MKCFSLVLTAMLGLAGCGSNAKNTSSAKDMSGDTAQGNWRSVQPHYQSSMVTVLAETTVAGSEVGMPASVSFDGIADAIALQSLVVKSDPAILAPEQFIDLSMSILVNGQAPVDAHGQPTSYYDLNATFASADVFNNAQELCAAATSGDCSVSMMPVVKAWFESTPPPRGTYNQDFIAIKSIDVDFSTGQWQNLVLTYNRYTEVLTTPHTMPSIGFSSGS